MKKLRYILPVLLAAVLLSACDLDDNNDYPTHMALTTVHVSAETPSEYYFTLDNNKTIYPSDQSRIGAYDTKDKEGKRAIVYFSMLEQPITGYDYSVAIYDIDDVLTKAIETAETEEQLTPFGNDRIAVESIWISGNWLNIYYCIPTNGSGSTKHRISMVDNKLATPPADMPTGYTYLEFRHHADGDTQGQLAQDYVSFKLDDYAPAVSGSKGLYIKVTPLTGPATYIKVEPKETTN